MMEKLNEKDFFINNFAYRKNILKWIKFDSFKEVVIMGSGYGILTECFNNSQVYCIEENREKNIINKNKHTNVEILEYNASDFLEKFSKNVDCIIFDGYLDVQENKENILKKCQSILRKDGQIIILTNNKLGLRYFSGAKEGLKREFDNLESNTKLYSKKEWEILLNKLNFEYQFFYPFPNYTFPEYVFKKTPKLSEINSIISSFDDVRYSYFDEAQAFQEIVKSGYFEDFNNSFLIVINKLLPNIEYVKFASERKKNYQIYTTINKDNDEKYVIKSPLYKEGYEHMETIAKYYRRFNMKNTNKKIKYCPVKLENNQLIFDFINGESLENLVYEDVKNNNISEIKNKLNIVGQIIDLDQAQAFYVDDQFIKIFGNRDYSILEGLKSHSFNNIDLIFDNIIVNDYYNIIDYEWVFECIIPESFILFRTLFHSKALSKLDKLILDSLYDEYGINKELRELYLKMETSFQNYVSDFKIKDIFDDFHCRVLKVKNIDDRKITNTILQNNMSYDYSVYDANEAHIEFDINYQDAVFCIDKKSIIKIKDILIDGKPATFTTNADVIVNGNYYFLNAPEIKIFNNSGKKLEIHVLYYYYADDCINDIISILKDNEKLNQRLTKLRKHPYVKLIEKIGG